MAKLLFLQDLEYEFLGPMYVSSFLKQNGHQVLLRIGSKVADFQKTLVAFKPDFVAFSVMSGSHHWAINTAKEIKSKYDIPAILGGPHPTYFPQVLEEGIDIIVRGEGEEACLELLNRVDQKRDYLDVKNVWVLRGGQIYKNELRPLNSDLDEHPFPDWELYADLKGRIDLSVRKVVTSRGCPWHCTFCFNDSMRELYQGRGQYVRVRNIDKIIAEAKMLRDRAKTRLICFVDDVFGLNSQWLYEFLPKYKKEVGLPFTCLVRADVICKDELYAQYLAKYGCVMACFGIETGNEHIRNNILHKSLSNAQIYAAGRSLHKAGVKFRTFNILGLPGETLEDSLSTVKMNIDIKTDYAWCSIFMPLPGTKLTEYAQKNGYLPEGYTIDHVRQTYYPRAKIVWHPQINQLQNLQDFFQTAVFWPWTFWAVKLLIKLPPNIIFTFWFRLIHFVVYAQSENGNLFRSLNFAIKNYQRLSNKYKR